MRKKRKINWPDLSQMSKRINGILVIKPNDVVENDPYMTWQFVKEKMRWLVYRGNHSDAQVSDFLM